MKIRFMNKLLFSLIVVTSLTFIMPTGITGGRYNQARRRRSSQRRSCFLRHSHRQSSRAGSQGHQSEGRHHGEKGGTPCWGRCVQTGSATNTATKLVSQGAHAVLGHICSGGYQNQPLAFIRKQRLSLFPHPLPIRNWRRAENIQIFTGLSLWNRKPGKTCSRFYP